MSAFDLRGAVTEFHDVYGHPIRYEPTLDIPTEELQLGLELIGEELGELTYAISTGDLIETADAIGDLLWVVESLSVRLGINTDRVLKEIKASNASKLGEDGKPVLRADGKILKGPNFFPPNISRALDMKHSYKEDQELDPEVDIILAPSGGLANMYIPTEYPMLKQLRVVTPLSVSRLQSHALRDVYVMKGITVGYDWPEMQELIEAYQASLGGTIYYLDC